MTSMPGDWFDAQVQDPVGVEDRSLAEKADVRADELHVDERGGDQVDEPLSAVVKRPDIVYVADAISTWELLLIPSEPGDVGYTTSDDPDHDPWDR